MNIAGNGQQRHIEHQRGGCNVNGNGNTLNITNSMMAISIMGNGNIIIVKGCSLQIQINGNGNLIQCMSCSVQIGVNGNNNQLLQNQSAIRINHIHGQSNHIDKGDQEYLDIQNSSMKNNAQNQINPLDLLSAVQQYAVNFGGMNNNNNPYRSVNNSKHTASKKYAPNNNIQSTNSQRMQDSSRKTRPKQQPDLLNQLPKSSNIFRTNLQSHQNVPNNYASSKKQHHKNNPQAFKATKQQTFGASTLFKSKTLFSSQNNEGLTDQQLQTFPITVHNGPQKQCTICLQPMLPGNQVIYLMCFHFFHQKCCQDWLRKISKCPMCQVNLREIMSKSKYMKLMQ